MAHINISKVSTFMIKTKTDNLSLDGSHVNIRDINGRRIVLQDDRIKFRNYDTNYLYDGPMRSNNMKFKWSDDIMVYITKNHSIVCITFVNDNAVLKVLVKEQLILKLKQITATEHPFGS